MGLLQLAMSQGADLDRLERLMQMKRDWEADEARKAFNKALAAFKANPPTLRKNKEVDFTGKTGIRTHYRHATLDEVAAQIGQALSPHGLSFRWNVEQKGPRVHVTCYLQHEMGHSETVTMDGPADDSGNKNVIQQVGSTVTYLERYTLLAITGMAVKDQDNDGRPPTPRPEASEKELDLDAEVAKIKAAPDTKALAAIVNAAYATAQKHGDRAAMDAINAAKDARLKELRPQPTQKGGQK
ncbi:ERF family protein [Mesoterricola sediminis]|nr:ERF family protein [Mesoterricola sediminis]